VADGVCVAVRDKGAKISVAGEDGGVVLQHRGREEEVRCTANGIHGAWRNGSPRRGGFDRGDFKNSDDDGFPMAVLGQEDKGRLQASHKLIIREGMVRGRKIGAKGIGRRFFRWGEEAGWGGPVWGRTPRGGGERGGRSRAAVAANGRTRARWRRCPFDVGHGRETPTGGAPTTVTGGDGFVLIRIQNLNEFKLSSNLSKL
jgi:hypothetical protein